MRRLAPTGRSPARASSATVPRTNARQPGAGWGFCERELVAFAEVERLRQHALRAVAVVPRLDPPGLHGHSFGDRERQRQAVVVVGVLADQTYAPGRERPRMFRRHR